MGIWQRLLDGGALSLYLWLSPLPQRLEEVGLCLPEGPQVLLSRDLQSLRQRKLTSSSCLSKVAT